jgi:hypothetical protein
MAHPVTIVGTITDSSGISKQVTITGIGSVVVDPGYGIPAPPDVIWGGRPPPHPAHPIAPGGQPPTATPPIYYPPVFPAHPIVPPPVDPGYGIPAPPLGIWGGAPPAHPAHPIAPGGPPPTATPPIFYPPEVWPKPPVPPEVPPVMPPGAILPPGWSWYYTNIWGWVLVWRPSDSGGKPQPPSSGGGPSVSPH